MSPYSHIRLIPGYIDAITPLLRPPQLLTLKEVGIFHVPLPPPTTQHTTTAIRLEEDNLGLASWSLTPLYVEAKLRLLAHKSDLPAASALLLASPDYTTAWNIRKQHLTPHRLQEELHFSKLTLLRSPKSAEAWTHRAWVLSKFGCTPHQAQAEMQLAWIAVARVKSNYYAGRHRLRVLSHLSRHSAQLELIKSRKWLHSHFGDSSAWWYHRRLILTLLHSLHPNEIEHERSFAAKMHALYQSSSQCVRVHQQWLSSQPKLSSPQSVNSSADDVP